MATKDIKDQAKAKKPDDMRSKVMAAYVDYYLTHGERPASVYAFCKQNKWSENDFYNMFSSFDAIEGQVWGDLIIKTVATIQKNEAYPDYSVNEKLLAFYYTLIEVMKQNRSFILATHSNREKHEIKPRFLKEVRKEFKAYINDLIKEGLENEELKKRPYLSDKYDEALWIQFLFVLHFWIKDDSKEFEQTDAAIEKAVKLSSELMREGPLDSFIDMAKFIFQNAR